MKGGNRIVINHIAGTIDRYYANGRIDKNIGSDNGKGALQIRLGGKPVLVHRLIYMDFHGPIAPWMQIDHILGKDAGNGISNLRWTDSQGNSCNRRKAHRSNKSGYLGVSWRGDMKKWEAVIMTGGKRRRIGFFDDPAVAHEAYVAEKRIHHHTCTI